MSTKPEGEPAHPELVLVDTSVWVQFFRLPASREAIHLDDLLSVGPVATCAPIRAEVVSGAPSVRVFRQLREHFSALAMLDVPSDLWGRLEEHRFTLARRGYQASLVDLMVAQTASLHGAALWTLDKDFQPIASVIPLRFYRAQTLVR